MSKQRFVKIERRRRLSIRELEEIYADVENRKNAGLIPPQIPPEQLSIKISKNIVTPDSAPIPDCLTCGVCCNEAFCVPVSPQDKTSPKNYWDITANNSSTGVVVERFLRHQYDTGNCSALKGKIRENVACEIYETRPTTCREFEAGSDKCHAFRRMYNLEEPLSEEEVVEAKAKLQQRPKVEKISWVSIVPEEFETERLIMTRLPDQTLSVVTEKNTEVICKIYVFFDTETPTEIYSYNPSEEFWLQHQFYGLTLAEAQNLISESKTRMNRNS